LASITEDDGWCSTSIQQYYLKSERLVQSSATPSIAGEANPKVHGNGPVQISLAAFKLPLDSLVVQASKVLGGRFPFNLDMQSGNSVGFSFAQSAVDSTGKRSSSATAYIEPALTRKNLDVLIQTQVTRLISTGTTLKGPSFNKVEFAQNATAKRFTVTAKNEVILSAGSLNTPQILLLSGIGNKTTLASMGIKTLVNLPDVGQHLQDHPILSNYYSVSSNTTWDNVLRDPTIAGADLVEWNTTGQGLFANAPGSSLGYVRLPDNATIFKQFPDPSAGPLSGNMEMIFADGFAATVSPQPATGNFVTVNTAVVTPLSRGSVTLNSTNPFTFPNIDPAFLTSPFDVFTMTQVVRDVREFLSASPFQGFITAPFGELGAAQTDDQIAAAARDGVVTIWHPTSTARMSPKGASWGVVDSDLLVKGVSGLRIVDASVFPIIPAAHTTGPVYIIAERAADLIKAAWE
jgi:choline dehydrogenase-like flavoprotein